MFAASILKSARSLSHTASVTHQQVRFTKKTFNLRKGVFGAVPLTTTDDFENAKEAGLLEDLSYKEIRFALPWENNSPLFDRDYERFCRYIMKGGRKELAHELAHKTLFNIKMIQYSSKADEQNPLTILKTALANCEPLVVTRRVKRGGATYQVPCPLSKDQSEYFALKWMIRAVLDRPKPRKKLFQVVMARELLDAFYGRGKVVKRRDDIHRLADANKAYAHYRWG